MQVDSEGGLVGLRAPSSLRPSQVAALAAFESDRGAGRSSTYVVAPAGSGKTVIGLEIARRLGAPVLVLAPTRTIAEQWESTLSLFCERPDAVDGVHVATYQSLCRTADPGDVLRRAAIDALALERAAVTSQPQEMLRTRLQDEPTTRDLRDIIALVAGLKRAAARDGQLSSLLADGARTRMRTLKAAGVQTVVLDECHHIGSLWGYLVAALLAELGERVHVVGLTATPPLELPADDAALYDRLLGPVDYEVPLPAVVRDGHLAPYQELGYFTEPLVSERRWLGERHTRFAELVNRLHEPAAVEQDEDLSFPAWVIGRIRYRDTGSASARVGFASLTQRRPDLARAGLRYLHAGRFELPDDAPRGEGWREAMTLDDWLVLIGDYAVGCLRAHPGPAANRVFEELALGLRDLGFVLTRTGVRRGASDVDRVLTNSQAKPIAAVEIIAAEAESRGERLRAAVLCDTEHAPRQPEGSGLQLGGGARALLRICGGDPRTAVLRPLLLTGRAVACLAHDAETFATRLDARAGVPDDEVVDLARAGWSSGEWVSAAGALLTDGTSQLIVGTRGLLGEGWDAPVLNCLIDLTTVAADVSVRQMRGRALRLDPADPDKVSSNWDVVCVAPDLARGSADYARFVRRHSHLRAPCEDGSIETGVSHVHATLSPLTPPTAAAFAELNDQSRRRADDLLGARARWAVGTSYVGVDMPVLLVTPPTPGLPPAASTAALRPSALRRHPPSRGPGLAFRLRAAERAYPDILPLDRLAGAVAEALAAVGDVSPASAASVLLVPRPGGVMRCLLADGTAEENERFTAGLDDALGDGDPPRWVVSRPAWPTTRSRAAVGWRALTGRPALDERWHKVPAELATHGSRAEVFHEIWKRWIGPGRLLFAGRTEAGRAARASALSEGVDYTASRRLLWR